MPITASKTDDKAFDAMMNSSQTTGNLYTESFYNTKATRDEQASMDRKAQAYLKRMYQDDKNAGLFEKLNYDQYIGSLSQSFFRERLDYPKDNDPSYFEEFGAFFNENYEGDFDQFRDSSMKYSDKEK